MAEKKKFIPYKAEDFSEAEMKCYRYGNVGAEAVSEAGCSRVA